MTRRLKSGVLPITPRKPPPIETPASGEVPKTAEDHPSLSKNHPSLAIPKILPWQLEANRGFVKAYISSLRYGPISNQHEEWARIGQRLNAQKLNAAIGKSVVKGDLQDGKVLIICGKKDVLILANELGEDAAKCLGPGNFDLKEVDAGHDLPVTRSREIVDFIQEFWQQ